MCAQSVHSIHLMPVNNVFTTLRIDTADAFLHSWKFCQSGCNLSLTIGSQRYTIAVWFAVFGSFKASFRSGSVNSEARREELAERSSAEIHLEHTKTVNAIRVPGVFPSHRHYKARQLADEQQKI